MEHRCLLADRWKPTAFRRNLKAGSAAHLEGEQRKQGKPFESAWAPLACLSKTRLQYSPSGTIQDTPLSKRLALRVWSSSSPCKPTSLLPRVASIRASHSPPAHPEHTHTTPHPHQCLVHAVCLSRRGSPSVLLDSFLLNHPILSKPRPSHKSCRNPCPTEPPMISPPLARPRPVTLTTDQAPVVLSSCDRGSPSLLARVRPAALCPAFLVFSATWRSVDIRS